MKQRTKIVLGIFILILIVASIFFIQMKKFADGVKEDAKKKRDFNEEKLNDSARMIFKKVE